MEIPDLPKKWPEKLLALSEEQGLPVDNASTVYTAIKTLKESEDPHVNCREFTIRSGYVYRLSNNFKSK